MKFRVVMEKVEFECESRFFAASEPLSEAAAYERLNQIDNAHCRVWTDEIARRRCANLREE